MVVAPPSIHPSGAQYAFLDALADIGEFERLPFDLTPQPEAAAPVAEVDWESLDALMDAQAPKLRAHWRLLKVPQGEVDRSRADFAVARCLWETGYTLEQVAAVLCELPGSKAKERGTNYAMRTAARAAALGGKTQ